MKKNLISVLILALLVVNLALTAIMMFSVTSASKKTAALVDNIATALNLELTAQTGEAGVPVVPIENIETYSLESGDALTISLSKCGRRGCGRKPSWITRGSRLSLDPAMCGSHWITISGQVPPAATS